jgi:multidrug efflux pump subunit AcrA (membrane-fusion protein)
MRPSPPTPPVLAVAATTLQPITLPVRLGASGNIMAWQEASIGTEADGLRLTTVRVNVGDVVRHGELLATFAADTIKAELAQDRATLAEAEALFAEAGTPHAAPGSCSPREPCRRSTSTAP